MATNDMQNTPAAAPGFLGSQTAPPETQDAAPTNAAAEQLTPQQKKVYQLVVKQAMGFLLEDEHAKLIVDKAESGDPKQAVVDAVGPLMQNIYASAQSAGAQVDMHIVLAASVEVIANLAQMLATLEIIQEADIPQFSADVAKMAVDQHNARAQGGA